MPWYQLTGRGGPFSKSSSSSSVHLPASPSGAAAGFVSGRGAPGMGRGWSGVGCDCRPRGLELGAERRHLFRDASAARFDDRGALCLRVGEDLRLEPRGLGAQAVALEVRCVADLLDLGLELLHEIAGRLVHLAGL